MSARQARFGQGRLEAEAAPEQECDVITIPFFLDVGFGRDQFPGLVDVVLWDVGADVDLV